LIATKPAAARSGAAVTAICFRLPGFSTALVRKSYHFDVACVGIFRYIPTSQKQLEEIEIRVNARCGGAAPAFSQTKASAPLIDLCAGMFEISEENGRIRSILYGRRDPWPARKRLKKEKADGNARSGSY
jgi:hypothetical protein